MLHHTKIFLFLVVIAGLSCAAFGAIFLADLQSSYDGLLASRLNVIAGDVASTIEARVNLGLPLNYLSDMQGTLERTRIETTGIESIGIAGDDGDILYSTDRVSIGSPAALPPGHAPTTLTEQDQLTVFIPLVNTFDKTIGTVIVSGTREHIDPTRLAALGPPFLAATGFVLLGLILISLLTRLFLRDLESRSRAVEADAEQALRNALDAGHDGIFTPTPHFLATRVGRMLEGLHLVTERVRAMDETT